MDQSTYDFFQFLLASLGGLKGASALVAAGVLVQLAVKFLSTGFFNKLFLKISGAAKLMIVSGLTLVSGVLGLMSQGVSLGVALAHSSTLAAAMVFIDQVYKHFSEKKIEG